MTSIETILRTKGPLLSGELGEILGRETYASKEAIRKRLSRTKLPVTRIRGFFADNQSLFYLQEQYQQEEYYLGMVEAFRKAAKRFYAVVKAIEFHHGYLKATHLRGYTFSPIGNLKGHKKIELILNELQNLGVIHFDGDSYGLHPSIYENSLPNHKEAKAVETAKNFVLTQFFNCAAVGVPFASVGVPKFVRKPTPKPVSAAALSPTSSINTTASDNIIPLLILIN